MKRRLFLGTATASAAALTAQLPSVAQSSAPPEQSSIRWRMATSWPKDLDIVFGAVDFLCQRVSAITDGRFTITPYAANEIAPGLKVMDAVSDGTVECGHTAGYYYIDKHPALGFATTLPFGLTTQQHLTWLQDGGLESIQKVYRDFNVINFPAGSTGAQMGGWFKREVSDVADLQGLKMRIPGLGGEVMKRLGVEVHALAGDQIYMQLEQNKIDAAEWVGPYEDEKLGLNRVAQYYYYPGWWEPGTTYELQINLEQWEQLPVAYQTALRVAAQEAHGRMLAEYDIANGDALQRLLLSGTQLLAFSPEILQAAQKASFEFYEETAADNQTFQDIYRQWQTFRTNVYRWHGMNEFSLNQFYAESLTA